MMRRLFTVIMAGMLFVSGGMIKVSAAKITKAGAETMEVLIVYEDTTTENKKQALLEKHGISQSEIIGKFDKMNMVCVEISAENGQDVVEEMKNDADIVCVQPNYRIPAGDHNELKRRRNIRAFEQYNSANKYGGNHHKSAEAIEVKEDFYQLQWGIENIGQTLYQEGITGIDANVKKAWSITTGSERVLVGVLDSGLDINNVDLQGNIYVNEREVAGNGCDDDGNGYIDDVRGWDFLNNDNSVYDSAIEDSHGTYVASILGAPLDDVGMVGICPNVSIVPLKFMSSVDGGDTSDAIRAIEYAKNIGVKIINCSWSGSTYNPALEEAMRRSGILFVCASGNEGIDLDKIPMYPACFELENVISVGAIDNQGDVPSYSNYSKTRVDVLAPGDAILGQFPGNMYYATSGTSAAAPFVAGEAALIYSINFRWDSRDIKKCIMRNVTKDARYTEVKTGGRIDVYKAVKNASHTQRHVR